jgi:hypothetical protein
MGREVWATYSVKDHFDRRALAADIMLFDRLVFPVPQKADFQYQGSDPSGQPTVQWSRNPAEWARWEKEHWAPESQESLLTTIGPVVRKVPWDAPHQEQWRTEFTKATAGQVPEYAFAATRTVLTQGLPAYVTGVEAMGPAYRSVEQLEKELGVSTEGVPTKLPAAALSAVLGWELVVPDDPRLSNDELLKETVAFVTGDADFRHHRSEFWNWQQGFLKDGVTDQESINKAVDEMRQRLADQQAAARRLPMKQAVRYAFRIGAPGLGLAAVFAGPAGVIALGVAGVFLTCAEIAAEKWVLKEPQQENEPSPTAFVHDVHRHFGWV